METFECYYRAWWLDDQVVILGLYGPDAKLIRIWQAQKPSDFNESAAKIAARLTKPLDEESCY